MSKRQIVLDTETTGLSVEDDHRIIEIGCIELRDRRPGDSRFHCYLNPDREVDAGAVEVHGISLERLRDAPRFAEIAEAFIEFVRGAEIIIHNARFDVGFIDHELARLGPNWGQLSDYCTVLDTLEEARKLHPGQRNSLDALCKRYEVENAHRTLHGAMLDAELLAEVYLAMTGGQTALLLEPEGAPTSPAEAAERWQRRHESRTRLRVVVPTAAEQASHDARLAVIQKKSGGRCVWLAEPVATG